MNKLIKIFIAILGATEVIFSIFIPIAISLLLMDAGFVNLSSWQGNVLIIAGIIASLYRAIDVGLITKE